MLHTWLCKPRRSDSQICTSSIPIVSKILFNSRSGRMLNNLTVDLASHRKFSNALLGFGFSKKDVSQLKFFNASRCAAFL